MSNDKLGALRLDVREPRDTPYMSDGSIALGKGVRAAALAAVRFAA
jgi:hypothetical protein